MNGILLALILAEAVPVFGSPTTCPAKSIQTCVCGRVVDSKGTPLPATITVTSTALMHGVWVIGDVSGGKVETNEDGRFQIPLGRLNDWFAVTVLVDNKRMATVIVARKQVSIDFVVYP